MNKEINRALQVLKAEGLILFPSDSFWSVGCDASNANAVKKLYKLKKQIDYSPLTCLVADDRMLKKYVKHIPHTAINIFEIADKPTTIVFDEAKNLAKNLIAKDGSIAIRIPDDDFCYWLIRKFHGAVACTSANIIGQPVPKSFKEIVPSILKDVDYVVNLQNEKIYSNPPSIIKLSNSGIVEVIRK